MLTLQIYIIRTYKLIQRLTYGVHAFHCWYETFFSTIFAFATSIFLFWIFFQRLNLCGLPWSYFHLFIGAHMYSHPMRWIDWKIAFEPCYIHFLYLYWQFIMHAIMNCGYRHTACHLFAYCWHKMVHIKRKSERGDNNLCEQMLMMMIITMNMSAHTHTQHIDRLHTHLQAHNS